MLAANAADLAAAAGALDEGALDRLRLDADGLTAIEAQLGELAASAPARARGRRLDAAERPRGLGGADPDRRRRGQLRGAAERRRRRRRPAAEEPERRRAPHRRRRAANGHHAGRRRAPPGARGSGLPPEAIGLVRSPTGGRARSRLAAARAAARDPPRQRRDHGRACPSRCGARCPTLPTRRAAGAVPSASADPAVAEAMIEASLDRLGVCDRLNLLLVDRAVARRAAAVARCPPTGSGSRRAARNGPRHAALVPLDVRLGHEWANDAERVATVSVDVVDGPDEAVRARERGDVGAGGRRRRGRRGGGDRSSTLPRHGGVLAGAHPLHRRLALTGAPETGINVDRVPGPRGPVTYRDSGCASTDVVGDGTQRR